MFKTIFTNLCHKKGVSPSFVLQELGYSNSVFSKWTDETLPRNATLLKVANYFNVSVEYLKGEEDLSEVAPIQLTSQEQTLIDIFRSTTEEGRLEMIASFMKIKNDIEKKHLDKNQDTSESNIG